MNAPKTNEPLKRQILSGSLWTSLSVVSEKLLGVITIAFLARLLEPKDFGLVAICMIVQGMVSYFTDIGFESAIIQRKSDVDKAATTAFFITVILGFCNYILLFSLSNPIAHFYENDAIADVIKVLSLTIVIGSFTRVHNFLLAKELQFRKKMVCETVPGIIYSCVSIPLAFSGYGVWSLVYGELAKSVTRNLLLILLSHWRPNLFFSLQIARELIAYGKHVMSANLINFASDNVDNALVGKYMGLTSLSFYKMSYNAAAMPQQLLYQIIGRVSTPAFAKVQDDRSASLSLYFRLMEYSSYMFVPVFLGLFITAADFINLIYGPKWKEAVPLFQALIVFGLARTIRMYSNCLFLGTGKPQILPKVTAVRLALVLVLLFVVFVMKFSLFALCIGISVLEVIILFYQLFFLRKYYQVSIVSHVNAVKIPFVFSFVMILSVLLITRMISWVGVYSTALLIVQISSGTLVYAFMMFVFKKDVLLKLTNRHSA